MSRFFQVKAYINHWLDAVEEHSLHSPFFFDFYDKVIRGKSEEDFSRIERIRDTLLQSNDVLQIEDLGSGSQVKTLYQPERRIADIATTSLTPADLAQIYFRTCQYTEVHNVVELGTSMGLTSLYFSELPDCKVHTFEGSHALANVALTNFEYLDKKNIHLIEGDIATRLMKRCNEKTIMVIDDIHHSPEMEKAWKELKKHYLVYGSVDLFRCGILFFEPGLNRQHFVWAL